MTEEVKWEAGQEGKPDNHETGKQRRAYKGRSRFVLMGKLSRPFTIMLHYINLPGCPLRNPVGIDKISSHNEAVCF